jgi:hypothetical protein
MNGCRRSGGCFVSLGGSYGKMSDGGVDHVDTMKRCTTKIMVLVGMS